MTFSSALGRDHPRMCGEKFTRFVLQKTPYGSPPRMRGKVHLHPSLQVHLGITPAYAGKSKQSTSNMIFSQDHPRVCGEKRLMELRGVVGEGSPPRMRGKVRG